MVSKQAKQKGAFFMNIGLVGLGKMGFNLGLNLMKRQHTVFAFDVNSEAVRNFSTNGGQTFDSLSGLVDALPTPRVIWLMVPAGEITISTIEQLKEMLDEGDILIDGETLITKRLFDLLKS